MGMFGGLGDMAGLMKKFGELQKNMKKMKEELAMIEVSGADASGRVEVRITGDFNVKAVRIDPALVAMNEPALVEGAVYEALTKALGSAKLESARKLSEATGGLPIPGLTD